MRLGDLGNRETVNGAVKGVPLHEAVDDYFDSKTIAAVTKKWYSGAIDRFVSWCAEQDITTIEGLTTGTLRHYLQLLPTLPGKRGTFSNGTVASHNQAVKTFVRFCVVEYNLSERLLQRLPNPAVEQKVIQVLSPDEIGRLLDACTGPQGQRNRTILTTFLDTGMRVGELGALRLVDVELTRDEGVLLLHGKGRKEREVGLGRVARREMRRWLRERESPLPWVFYTREGRQVDKQNMYHLLKMLGTRAGVSGLHPHLFRHTFAVTYLKQPGTDIYKLSRLLGHTTVSTTERYLRGFQAREARQGPSVADAFL